MQRCAIHVTIRLSESLSVFSSDVPSVTASNRPSPALSDVITNFLDDGAVEDQDTSLRSSKQVMVALFLSSSLLKQGSSS
jgi:hypothetical protein